MRQENEPSNPPDDPDPANLRRDLGLLDAVAVGLGAILGAGIFVVIGLAAQVAGPALLVGLLLAGVAATCNALSSAQLAATYPQAGGTYEYGYRVLRPEFGFAAGWTFLTSKLAAGGVVALGFGSYLSRLVPGISPKDAALAAVFLLCAANLFGIKKAGRLNVAILTMTLLALISFVLAGCPAFQISHFTPFAPNGGRSILEAAALLFFAYTGYARIATLGEEVKDPRRTLPRAILISLGTSLLLYLAVSVVAIGAVGTDALAASPSPLERAAQAFPLAGLSLGIAVGATTAMLGVLLSQILGISRMMFAMARRGDLPTSLNHVQASTGAPDRGILLTGLILVLLVMFGTLEWTVSAATFAILLYYSIANLAALRMPPADKLYPDGVARLGFFCCLLLAVSLQPRAIVYGIVLLVMGFAYRTVLRRWRTTRVSVIK